MSRHLPDKRRSVSTEEIEPRPRHFTHASLTVHKRVNSVARSSPSRPRSKERSRVENLRTTLEGHRLGSATSAPTGPAGENATITWSSEWDRLKFGVSLDDFRSGLPSRERPTTSSDGSAPSL